MPPLFFRIAPLRAAVVALLILCAATVSAQDPVCHLCGRTIRRGCGYFKFDSQDYCSRECAERAYERTIPVCAVCGKRCPERYLVSGGRNFCSQECLETTFPVCTVCGKPTPSGSRADDGSFFVCPECMKKPRCFACGLPADADTLPDGRVICGRCDTDAVSDSAAAERIFRQVRRDLRERLGIFTDHEIAFALIDRPTMHRFAAGIGDNPNELGLFVHKVDYLTQEQRDRKGRVVSRKTEKSSESFDIYALDFMPPERLEYVCAHELAHDWMAEHYPNITDPVIKEGFAEYVGWLYNRTYGRASLNRQIEKNIDPVYGGGFRRMKRIADRGGFEGVRRYLESKNR